MMRFSLLDDIGPLYRDSENGWFMGVCAGVAGRFGLTPLLVRLIALILLAIFFVPTVVLYVTAAILLRDRPLQYFGETPETRFWAGRKDRSWVGDARYE